MNVVLVTHDSIFGRYVAATLADAGVVDRVLVERARATPGFYWRKLWRVGPVNFGFQYWLNRWFEREARRALPDRPLPSHERIASVNALTFDPNEIVLGFGTSYVRQRTLAAAPNGILNLHTGILPRYRGVKSEFWALHNGEPEQLGWTLHYMTPRLDAGDIVLDHRVPWEGESPGVARARIVQDAATGLTAFLRKLRRGETSISRTPQEDRDAAYYSTPTRRDWIAARSRWTQ